MTSLEKALDKATFDLLEVLGFAHEMIGRGVFMPENNIKLNQDWRAFSISSVICYARPFKKSYDLQHLEEDLTENLSDEDLQRHKNFIDKRDQLVAHGDGKLFEIEGHGGTSRTLHSDPVYLDEMEVNSLIQLTSIILKRIDELKNT